MTARRAERITMLLENNPYPEDVRVRAEAVSLARAGHEVTVIAPRGRGQSRRETIEGVRIVRFREFDGSGRGPAGYAVEYAVAALALHAAALQALLGGATVLHIHNPPDILAGAGAIFRLAGRRVIFDHHDLFPETIEAKFGPGLLARAAMLGQRLTYSVANHVLATNESYAQIARERGSKAHDAVTVVRNAPPSSWLRPAATSELGRLQRLQIAYVGAVSTQDGVEGLAPVLAALRNGAHGLDAHLTVIGDGDGRPSLEAALRAHEVSQHVTITGWVPVERVPELLADADVCVDPAPATPVNQRSTMMKVAEYIALAKPVVAYDLLETRRTAGDAALLVQPGDVDAFSDGIARIASDPALRQKLAGAAATRAPDLVWEHSERALLEVYAHLYDA